MTKTTNNAAFAARKLGLAVAATGMFILASGIAAPQQAKAFGIGDVFGVVEDVWEIGADAAERAGRKIGKEAKKIGRGTITPTKPRRRRVTGTPVTNGTSALPPARRPANSSALPPARGTAKPTGDRGLPPPRKPNQRPRPITENDVKPPFCNSKFENCSNNGGHGHDGHHDHHGKKGKHSKDGKKLKKSSSRDKSISSKPVGKRSRITVKHRARPQTKRSSSQKAQIKHRVKVQPKRGKTQNIKIKRSDKKVQFKHNDKKRSQKRPRKSNRRG